MIDSGKSSAGKKMIPVVCGIVMHMGKVLVTQRGAGMHEPLKWEFPGGKMEPGEMAEHCLHRELAEELGITVKITGRLRESRYEYDDFSITLLPLIAEFVSGDITLHEHANYKWVSPGELGSFDWAPADVQVVADLMAGFSG
jgi:8-oxo-dGTP diphosphatase